MVDPQSTRWTLVRGASAFVKVGEPVDRPSPDDPRSDAEGRFALTALEPGKNLVTARLEGYRDARVEIEAREGETTGPVRLVLPAAYRLVVLVRDGDGRPVPGAEVTIAEKSSPYGHWHSRDWERRTDDEGEARFAVRVLEVRVSVLADGFRAEGRVVSLSEASATRVEMLLQPGGAMRGRIVDAKTGEPIPGEPRRLMVSRSFVGGRRGAIGQGMMVSPDGSFHDRGLAPGPYTLWIMAPGYRELRVGPRVLEAGKTLDWGTIRLDRGHPVEARVVDGRGRPIEGASVDPLFGPSEPVRSCTRPGRSISG